MHENECVHLQVEHRRFGSLAPARRASDGPNSGLVDHAVNIDVVFADCQDERKRALAIVVDKVVGLWVEVAKAAALRISVVKVADSLLVEGEAVVHRSLGKRLNCATLLELFLISKVDDLVEIEAILALNRIAVNLDDPVTGQLANDLCECNLILQVVL